MNEQLRLVAIIRNIDPSNILFIADALLQEGIRSIEVSLSEPDKGFACLEIMKKRYSEDELCLGAGTVLRPNEVKRLNALGIRYFFTPGFDAQLVDCADKLGMQIVPGVLTPSDVQQAVVCGISLLKLFPANAYHKTYIKDLRGPFPRTEYLAVGGVSPDNLSEYLSSGFFGAGIGGSLVPQGASKEQLPQISEAAGLCARVIAAHAAGKE